MLYRKRHTITAWQLPRPPAPPGHPPCRFTTTRRRWSALLGLSETNKSKPKQMATDAAADTLPSRSDRDGLFDKPAETSWIQNPSPSHPYDRAKAHNKRVAIMRCPILSVEWHFPPNQAARLQSHSKSCSACTVARQMSPRREGLNRAGKQAQL